MARRKGKRVTRKTISGDSRRALGVKMKTGAAKTGAAKSAYSVMNGRFRVLSPLVAPTTDKKALAAAVSSVVAKMKS